MSILSRPPAPASDRVRQLFTAALIASSWALAAGAVTAQVAPTKLSDLQAVGGAVEDVQVIADGDFILYTADAVRRDQAELWSVERADGVVRKLSPDLADDEELAQVWAAPDGSRVAFEIERPFRQDRRLFTAAPGGGQPVLISGPADYDFNLIRNLQWTPDSSTVVYTATLPDDTTPRLFAAPATGGPAVELTGPIATQGAVSGRLRQFTVTPDGTRVVFWGDLDLIDTFDAFAVPIGGGARTNLTGTLPADADVVHATVSPDGQTVILGANIPFATTLFTVPVTGGAPSELPSPGSFGLFLGGTPIVFTPTANRIVYQTTGRRVFSQGLDGSTPVEMGSGKNSEIVQWGLTPNGARVLVLERTGLDTELFSTFVSTGPPLKISSTDLRGRRIRRFTVSPSSEFLAYTADDRVGGREELFVSFTFGTGALRVSPLDFAGSAGISPDFFYGADGSRLIYRGDVLESGVLEVFSVDPDGGPSTRLNLDLPADGDVISRTPGADADEVLYVGGQNLATANELYTVDALGASMPEKLGGSLMARIGEVERFEITDDGAYAVYLADQRLFDRPELWSVATGGGPPIRLSPDLGEGEDVDEFQLARTSDRAVLRIGRRLWSVSIADGGPVELSPGTELNTFYRITPDGQFVIVSARASNRQSLLRIPIAGGQAEDILPLSVGFTPDFLVITPDSQRLLFLAPNVPFEGTPARLYAVPVLGGDAIRLSNLPLTWIRSFGVSGDGSYAFFTSFQPGTDGLALFGTPTDQPNTVELFPPDPSIPFSETPRTWINEDGSFVAYILDGELFSVETETGVLRNLTESVIGTPQDAEFVGDGDALLLARGPNQTRSLDVFAADGSSITPLTNSFLDPEIGDYRVVGDTVSLIVDPEANNPLVGNIAFQTSLSGQPRLTLSGPDQNAFGAIEATEDFVVFQADDGLSAVPSGGGPRLHLRPRPAIFREGELTESLFYTATEPGNPLIELYVVEVASTFVFFDGFESGDTSRWSTTVNP
ncbi:MAG: hypothetical protein AAGM22_27850 [Acidobacteriota bacterium]